MQKFSLYDTAWCKCLIKVVSCGTLDHLIAYFDSSFIGSIKNLIKIDLMVLREEAVQLDSVPLVVEVTHPPPAELPTKRKI